MFESIREGYHSFLALNSFVSFFVMAIEFVFLMKFEFEKALIYERYLFREVERRHRLLRVFSKDDGQKQSYSSKAKQ